MYDADTDASVVTIDALVEDAAVEDTIVDALAQDAPVSSDASSGCEDLFFADVFPRGNIGETASFSLGILRAEQCLQDCEPELLYVGDQGLGVRGTLVDGDSVAGYDRITLTLSQPTSLGYYVYRGENRGSDLRIYHRIEAYAGDALVLDMTVEGREYRMPPMPVADRIVWSAVGDPGEFADAYTVQSVRVCPSLSLPG